jgi:hypothetical protein
MTLRNILFNLSGLILCSLLISGCVRSPSLKGEGYALVNSNYPIINHNGDAIKASYKLDIRAVKNTLVIVYNTYQHNYNCTFSWDAVSGTIYEVTDHEKRYPLTLYRWVRKNSLWANRLDPVDPQTCVITSPETKTQTVQQ